jgi:hypothetical protein
MTHDSPPARGRDPGERPSRASRLKITVTPLGSAEGTVPPSETRYLITTFGILGSVVTGTAGAVLTMRIAPGLIVLALAELGLALVAAAFIATCSRGREGPQKNKTRQGEPP